MMIAFLRHMPVEARWAGLAYTVRVTNPIRAFHLLLLVMTSSLPAAEDYVRVSPRDHRYLELSSGAPYIPIGLNLIAPPRAGSIEDSLRIYESWLEALASQGGNYVRFWMSNPFWDFEHEKSGVYDESRTRLIEQALVMCRRRGIRVKLTIEHFRSVGGGPQAWADKPLHNRNQGGTAESIADFFDGEAPRSQFRRKIAWLKERFGSRPEVYGWELWNEVNAVRGGDYMDWTAAMLPELHRAFPMNLCMQSLGSFDSSRAVPVYRKHSLLPGNDLAQVHRYLDLGAQLEICHGPVDVLAADAVRELFSYNPGRPVILAESGAVEPRHTGPFHLYKADKDGTLLHDILFAPFFSGAAGPGQIWHWDSYVAANNLWWHFGRFAETVKELDPPAERFQTRLAEDERLRIYILAGKRTTLAWLRDKQSDWRTELEQGRPAETIDTAALKIPELLNGTTVRAYDPWLNQWRTLQVRSGLVKLPAFRRSLVLRWSTQGK